MTNKLIETAIKNSCIDFDSRKQEWCIYCGEKDHATAIIDAARSILSQPNQAFDVPRYDPALGLVHTIKEPVNKMLMDALIKLAKNVEENAKDSFVSCERDWRIDFANEDPEGFEVWNNADAAISAASSAPVVEVVGLEDALNFEDRVSRSFVSPIEAEYHTAIVEAARLQLARQKGGE